MSTSKKETLNDDSFIPCSKKNGIPGVIVAALQQKAI
jgi:hypothetical protein